MSGSDTSSGRHAARRAIWLRHLDDYINAIYTPLGQRGLVINIVGLFLLLVNLAWLLISLFV